MLNIYLARHGQDEDNRDGLLNGRRDRPLTDVGKRQAEEAACQAVASDLHFDVVYTSPLQRAHVTAHIIAAATGSPEPRVLFDLIERDFGVMTGESKANILIKGGPDFLVTDTITYFLSPIGAESFPDLVIRGQRLLLEIQRRHQSGNILLVSHGDIGKMIYAAYYDLPWQDVLRQFHFGNSEFLLLSTTSRSEDAHVFNIEQHNN